MRASFVRMDWENTSHTIASFLFEPASRYRYEPGQYAVLHVPHTPVDSRGLERTMTLTSIPEDPFLRFTMRLQPDGGSSFKRALLALVPGDEVTIFDSMGDMILPLDSSAPMVFAAGGIGVASFVGILRWLTLRGEIRDISLLYSVSSPQDIIMRPVIEAYAAAVRTAGMSSFQYELYERRLQADDVMAARKPDSLVYLSGPEQMVLDMQAALKTAGLSGQRLLFDYFDGYDSAAA